MPQLSAALKDSPRDVVWNQNFGRLGTGLPYAVGASIADGGKRPVLFTTSDFAFLYHIAELEVVHRYHLPMVIVVAVDNAWGLEVGVYKRTFGHDRIFRNQRIGGDNCLSPDLRTGEHNRAHADCHPVPDCGAVNNSAVADSDFIANNARSARVKMKHGVVLHV